MACVRTVGPAVSYTHLDVYKRQAVAMSGCYAFRDRILSRTGTVVQVETLESGFMVYVEFEN